MVNQGLPEDVTVGKFFGLEGSGGGLGAEIYEPMPGVPDPHLFNKTVRKLLGCAPTGIRALGEP